MGAENSSALSGIKGSLWVQNDVLYPQQITVLPHSLILPAEFDIFFHKKGVFSQ
jgi:hypothetical protein